jgi:tetratricopeptide (TPR) repeat protein
MPRAPLAKPAGVQQAIAQAVTLHQQGRLVEAERLYNGVLAANGDHFDALHLLGVLMHQSGRSAEALKLISKALKTGAKSADALSNYGRVLATLGRNDDALASFEKALALKLDHLEALFHRGNALIGLARFTEAMASYDAALAIKPDHVAALVNRGVALRRLRRPAEALASLDRALELSPAHAEALAHRGHVLADLMRPDDALASYDRALKVRPDDAETLISRGDVLFGLQRFEEALAGYNRALALRPNDARLLSNHGNALCELHRPADALASFERALARSPDEPGILNNRGNALLALNRANEALASYDRALAISPDDAQTLINRGNALADLARADEALESYELVLAAAPDNAEAHWNKSLILLTRGDFAPGFAAYEWRKLRAGATDRRDFPQPLWRGEGGIEGKTILLHAEQGFGDTIQFVRYAPLLAARGANIVLEAQRSLTPLLAGLDGVSAIVARGEALPPFDWHCPLLSLPLAFKTSLATVPGGVPYLRASPDRVETWRSRLPQGRPLRVGLAWSGSPTHKNDHNRSIALRRLAPLLTGSRVRFVSLQRELRDGDLEFLQAWPDVVALSAELEDFADTAAVISLLDLVISVDTGVAHLAGALGKPVWILLPFNGEWRWLAGRNDSPWYPTARLFRQPKVDDWESVIEQARQELAALQKP